MAQPEIDIDRIRAQALAASIEYHQAIGSTNDRAKECVRLRTAQLPLLVIAERQTAGRGRGTNRWWSGRGSLAFSVAFDSGAAAAAPAQLALVSLAAAVAVVDAVQPLLSGHQVGICWPNDVYAAGRKLSGILVEVLPNRCCIVGIGVNTNNTLDEAPPELRQTAVTLRDLAGREHDQTDLLISVLEHLEAGLGQLAREPEAVARRADRLCLQHGETLTVELPGRRITGVCLGIAADGALLLQGGQGTVRVYSGALRP